MITSIGHAAFDCYKWDETLDFYTRILGFERMFDLNDDEGKLWIVYVRVSDSVFIELFPKTGEAPKNAGSYSHLCLEVTDIENTFASVVERGAPVDSPVQTGKSGNRQAWTRDPEGNRIEFMETAPDSLQRQAIERLKSAAK